MTIVGTTHHSDVEMRSERITDITDLQSLRQYACPKNQHIQDWYMECVNCKSRNTCKAGKQAVFIMENETSPTPSSAEVNTSHYNTQAYRKVLNTRKMIEDVFNSDDPIKELLTRAEGTKPHSICAKVSVWRKNYPDLEEKYHMMDKVRFLWTREFDSMTIPEIIKKLYPEKEPEPQKVQYTEIAPNSKIFTVKPKLTENEDDDSISLEDFLKETDDEPETDIPEKEVKKTVDIQDEGSKMKDLLEGLEKKKADLQSQIEEINKQIDAIHIVQKMLGNGVA